MVTEFIEKQYLGRDYPRISIRLVMVLFCFGAYFISEQRDKNANLFLVVGCGILIVSVIMMFLLHFKTTVKNNSVTLDGLWTTKRVKIDLNSIVKIERKPYSSYFINNPVYNLHQKGKIRFYAGGKEAIWLTDRDGLIYILGTEHPGELEQAIRREKETAG
ncbi:hypothetical protein FW774_01800 (plasmid) [Pedobacter sp. BS3]|uniref:hypothetical protein n=1 Tax=Pedobacter sp. BS3 TaxID=2567937 RepID=UPI0011ECBAC9|nr:hypothetical protein [Pedobacter sp. BS3]TZF85830.1 hypothetical protein FW774_01800 [Pedobacter sp. BS3]